MWGGERLGCMVARPLPVVLEACMYVGGSSAGLRGLL
jgi:hypothetical protein